MMMKYSEVLENGEYKKSKNAILTYGTMTYIRVAIVTDGTNLLANAATIAMRYSTGTYDFRHSSYSVSLYNEEGELQRTSIRILRSSLEENLWKF